MSAQEAITPTPTLSPNIQLGKVALVVSPSAKTLPNVALYPPLVLSMRSTSTLTMEQAKQWVIIPELWMLAQSKWIDVSNVFMELSRDMQFPATPCASCTSARGFTATEVPNQMFFMFSDIKITWPNAGRFQLRASIFKPAAESNEPHLLGTVVTRNIEVVLEETRPAPLSK